MSPFMKRYQKITRWLPAFCFASAIFIFSATPGKEIGQSYDKLAVTLQTISAATAAPAATQTSSPVPILKIPFPVSPALLSFLQLDWLKIGHIIGYFWLGFTVLYAFSTRSRWNPSMALLLCCLYSFTDEFHQMFTAGRHASARDILIDTVAALAGVTIMLGAIASRNYFTQK